MAIDLSFDDDQLMLQRSAGEFFRRRYPSETVREIEAGDVGYSPDTGARWPSLGWLGITIPEPYGGGAGASSTCIRSTWRWAATSCRAPISTPWRSPPRCSCRPGPTTQRESLLPRIADGDCIVIPAILEPDGAFAPDSIACRDAAR